MISVATDYGICRDNHRVTCVIDGDTFWLRGEKIRINNIDAPELLTPKCPAELALAQQATVRLAELLGSGRLRVLRDGIDKYGRTLAVVQAGGADVGDGLVAEGLARTWSGRREPWC